MSGKFPAWLVLIRKVGATLWDNHVLHAIYVHDEFATLCFRTILKSSLFGNLMSLFLPKVLGVTVGGVGGGG